MRSPRRASGAEADGCVIFPKGVFLLKRFLLAVLAAICLPLSAFALPLTTQEIADMVQECPTLDDYPDSPAVIWSKKLLYTQDSKKREVKTVSYVILCSPYANPAWLCDEMIAPAGGSIELEQAAIFDPGSLEIIKHLTPSVAELAKGHIQFDFPDLYDDYVLVLSYRQIFSEPDVLEDIAWLGSEYPTWEGSVQVRVSPDSELLYTSSKGVSPTKTEDANFRRYGWFYFKQPANRGVVGIVESSDPYVLFGLSRGEERAVAAMNELAGRVWPEMPSIYVESEGGKREKVLNTIERFWRSPARIRGDGTFRSKELVPELGPWTTCETAYVLAEWLEKQGWKAEVWFQHAVPQAKDSISCLPAFGHPVLHLTEPGAKKSFYYVPGQPGEGGKIPAILRGKEIYTGGSNKLRKKSFSPSDMSKNRLSIAWNIKADAECNVEGTIDIRVRQAWTESFEALSSGRKELIYELFPGLRGWINLEDEFEVKPLGSQGFKIVLPVKANSGIQAPNGLMIGVPSVIPAPILRLHDIDSSAVLKFPFVIEQSYRISLPKNFRVLSVPLNKDQASAVSGYTCQYRLNKRTNVIEGEEKLVHSDLRVEAAYIPGFKRIIEMWGSWRDNELVMVPSK